ncbi:MAG: cupin domain-containing protein [Gammaproteobacteria bacterium]
MIGNLFAGLPGSIPEELFETLVIGDHFRLERIIAFGHATPAGQWYDQEVEEWVVLLSGGASLLFEGESEVVEMRPGDYIQIPAHRRHRVEWTAAGEKPFGSQCTTSHVTASWPIRSWAANRRRWSLASDEGGVHRWLTFSPVTEGYQRYAGGTALSFVYVRSHSLLCVNLMS